MGKSFRKITCLQISKTIKGTPKLVSLLVPDIERECTIVVENSIMPFETALEIQGGKPLNGDVAISGAKKCHFGR